MSNVSKRITGISGPPEKVAEVVKGFRVYAKKVPLTRTSRMATTRWITPLRCSCSIRGRVRRTIAYGENPDTAVKKLENLIKG